MSANLLWQLNRPILALENSEKLKTKKWQNYSDIESNGGQEREETRSQQATNYKYMLATSHSQNIGKSCIFLGEKSACRIMLVGVNSTTRWILCLNKADKFC